MKLLKKTIYLKYQGTVLLISLIFVLIFSALAVSIAALSGTNVQLASNQHKVDRALAGAESGMEVTRFWLNRVIMPSSTQPSDYLSTIIDTLQNDLAANGISNITVNVDGSIQPVTLDSVTGRTFNGQSLIDPNDPNTLQVYTTGDSGQITRTIKVCYDIDPYEYPIFDFGMAIKGPLNFNGNPTLNGVNADGEADIYNVDLQGDVLIGGDSGQAAIDNHVFIGADPVEFPVPDTERFLQYATGDIIKSSTDTSSSMTLTNATIKAGTDPVFDDNVRIEGVLFIEQPNIVTFNGNVDVQGLIVGDGDVDNPGTNTISFLGNFETNPYPPGAEFDAIRSETGSSILAPGFAVSFEGNFSALSGVMAVSGASFSGNVNATVEGTIINYSENPTTIEGNATLNFDRSDDIKIPAGFDLIRVLTYDSSSYEELVP
jgi:hypothetical protein